MKDFYLISTELVKPYVPRGCRVLRRLRNNVRDDLALVEVDPPIAKDVYGTEEDLRKVILASSAQGQSLFPVRGWPTFVYICRLTYPGEPIPEDVDNDFRLLDKGEVHRTWDEAAASLRLLPGGRG